jgi:hypothetical protein
MRLCRNAVRCGEALAHVRRSACSTREWLNNPGRTADHLVDCHLPPFSTSLAFGDNDTK